MLNKSDLHLNENGTKRLVNNLCFSMTKWSESICLGRPTTTTKVFLKENEIKLCSGFSTVNTARPIITKEIKKNLFSAKMNAVTHLNPFRLTGYKIPKML